MTEYLSSYQLFIVTCAEFWIIVLYSCLQKGLQNGWHEQIAPPDLAKVWIDMFDYSSFQLFDKGEIYRDK